MRREVFESVSTNASNERVHVAPKIAAEEQDYEEKECTEENSLSQNHKSSNVITEVLYKERDGSWMRFKSGFWVFWFLIVSEWFEEEEFGWRGWLFCCFFDEEC